MSNYITTVETAKLAKKALRKAFPDTKFSVRSDKYAGGSSINVTWTDGPTEEQVKEVAGKFHGSEFDGMIDLKYSNGRPFLNDYIFFNRKYSIKYGHLLFAYVDMRGDIDWNKVYRNLIDQLSNYGDYKTSMRKPDGNRYEFTVYPNRDRDLKCAKEAFEAMYFDTDLIENDEGHTLIVTC